MSRHCFVSKFLQEILIIVVLIFCLNFPASKYPLLALIYYQFLALLLLKDLVLFNSFAPKGNSPVFLKLLHFLVLDHIYLNPNSHFQFTSNVASFFPQVLSYQTKMKIQKKSQILQIT